MYTLSTSARITILFLFWALLAVFAFTILTMFSSVLRDTIRDAILWQAGALFLLGALLTVRTMRAPVEKSIRGLLLLTGLSALSIVIGVVGHNFLYGLATLAEEMPFLNAVLSALEVAFFLAATVLFPATFVIAAAGVIVLLVRGRRAPVEPPPGGLRPAH